MSLPRPLVVILVLAALQAVAWTIATAPFQGPDEAGHFAYVQHVAETGNAPQVNGHQYSYSSEAVTAGYQLNLTPIVGILGAQPSYAKVDFDGFANYEKHLPHGARSDGSGPNPLAKNGPLYYYAAALPYHLVPGGNIFDRLFAIRLFGGALFVGTVLMTWLLAAELFVLTWPRVVAASAVALQPKLGYIATIVNPDILLCFIWSAFAVVAMRTLKRGPTPQRIVGMALLAGASTLTHGRGLALIPPTVLAIALAFQRWRPTRRQFVRLAGAALGVMLTLGVIAFAFTSAHSTGGAFGGEVRNAGGGAGNLRQFISYLWQFYFKKLDFMLPMVGPPYGYRQVYIETFFSTLGGLEIVYRPKYFDLLQVGTAVGLAVLYTQLIWFRVRLVAQWRAIVVLATMCISQVGLLHLISYRDLVGNPSDPVFTGRYLLPLIAIFGVTIAFVCLHLPRRLGPLVAGAILGVGIVLQLSGLGMSVARYYG